MGCRGRALRSACRRRGSNGAWCLSRPRGRRSGLRGPAGARPLGDSRPVASTRSYPSRLRGEGRAPGCSAWPPTRPRTGMVPTLVKAEADRREATVSGVVLRVVDVLAAAASLRDVPHRASARTDVGGRRPGWPVHTVEAMRWLWQGAGLLRPGRAPREQLTSRLVNKPLHGSGAGEPPRSEHPNENGVRLTRG